MNGHWIPPEIFMLEPWYENFFSNMATVQFDHRLLATIVVLLAVPFWFRARRATLPRRTMIAAHCLVGALALQAGLGIATLLLAVPLTLAAAHQAGALLLFTAALALAHELHCAAPGGATRPRPASIGR
jgi:cytochrome c oxidase assembly protein subunit 15